MCVGLIEWHYNIIIIIISKTIIIIIIVIIIIITIIIIIVIITNKTTTTTTTIKIIIVIIIIILSYHALQHQRLSLLSLREESHNGTPFLLTLPELEHYLTLRNLYLPMSFSLQLTLL